MRDEEISRKHRRTLPAAGLASAAPCQPWCIGRSHGGRLWPSCTWSLTPLGGSVPVTSAQRSPIGIPDRRTDRSDRRPRRDRRDRHTPTMRPLLSATRSDPCSEVRQIGRGGSLIRDCVCPAMSLAYRMSHNRSRSVATAGRISGGSASGVPWVMVMWLNRRGVDRPRRSGAGRFRDPRHVVVAVAV